MKLFYTMHLQSSSIFCWVRCIHIHTYTMHKFFVVVFSPGFRYVSIHFRTHRNAANVWKFICCCRCWLQVSRIHAVAIYPPHNSQISEICCVHNMSALWNFDLGECVLCKKGKIITSNAADFTAIFYMDEQLQPENMCQSQRRLRVPHPSLSLGSQHTMRNSIQRRVLSIIHMLYVSAFANKSALIIIITIVNTIIVSRIIGIYFLLRASYS